MSVVLPFSGNEDRDEAALQAFLAQDAVHREAHFRWQREAVASSTKSPIEASFGRALCLAAETYGCLVQVVEPDRHVILNPRRDVIGILPQRRLIRGGEAARVLTVDFVLLLQLPTRDRLGALVAECDGHDFHSITKEQAASDRARDRALLREGVASARWTGSEIYADAYACAVEAIELLYAVTTQNSAAENINYVNALTPRPDIFA